MKKLFILLAAALFCCLPTVIRAQDDIPLAIDETNFPDPGFLEYVKQQWDNNRDGVLDRNERDNAWAININEGEYENIRNFQGIEYFPNLELIVCHGLDELENVDVSRLPNLREIFFAGAAKLSSLNIDGCSALQEIICVGTNLTELTIIDYPALERIHVGANEKLDSLTIKNCPLLEDLKFDRCRNLSVVDIEDCPILEKLEFDGCWNLSVVKIEDCPVLEKLDCSSSDLLNLEVKRLSALKELLCKGERLVIHECPSLDSLRISEVRKLEINQCKGLKKLHLWSWSSSGLQDLSVHGCDSLIEIDCCMSGLYASDLTTLNLSDLPALQFLQCSNSKLTTLKLPELPALVALLCGFSNLTDLDLPNSPKLGWLYCTGNNLTDLDLSNSPKLEMLMCDGNNLRNLDLSNLPALEVLSCAQDSLTNLDLSNNSALKELYCQNNKLTDLDLSNNPKLEKLNCYNTDLTNLDLSNNPALSEVNCSLNNLTNLDLSNSPALTLLYCDNNNLIDLDLSNNPKLERLDCEYNNLTSLDLSDKPALRLLFCYDNNLADLDFSNNPKLEVFYCSGNNLTNLDLSNLPALDDLNCGQNSLTNLDLSNNPKLRGLGCYSNNLTSLDLSNNPALRYVDCSSNNLTSLDLSNVSDQFAVLSSENCRREVSVSENGTFDLNLLPGFDISRASDWQGGSVQGNILTFHDTIVTYSYLHGHGEWTYDGRFFDKAITFKLAKKAKITVPSFSLQSGSQVKTGDSIRLYCKTENAIIYYAEGKEAVPYIEYSDNAPILIEKDTTYLRAWAMIAGTDTSEIAEAVYYVAPEIPDDPDTVEVLLPTELTTNVVKDAVTFSWNSQKDYIYRIKISQILPEQNSIEEEVVSQGMTRTFHHVPHLENGTFSWAVRVTKVGERDTLSAYVPGENFVIEPEVGTETTELEPIRIYPNPNGGLFHVAVPESVLIEILTPDGRIAMRREAAAGTHTLHLAHKGFYFVRLTTAEGRMTVRKIVVR